MLLWLKSGGRSMPLRLDSDFRALFIRAGGLPPANTLPLIVVSAAAFADSVGLGALGDTLSASASADSASVAASADSASVAASGDTLAIGAGGG